MKKKSILDWEYLREWDTSEHWFLAEVVKGVFPGQLYYLNEKKEYLLWNKDHWSHLVKEQIFSLGNIVAERLPRISPDISRLSESEKKEYNLKFSRLKSTFRKIGGVRSAFTALNSMKDVRTTIDDWFQPGIVSTGREIFFFDGKEKTIKYAPPTPEYRVYQKLGCYYEPEAECPRFLKFLDEITEGNTQKQDYIQKMYGLVLLGDNRHQAIFFLLGVAASGKSTLVTILAELLGDYSVYIPFDTLEDVGYNRIPMDIAMLSGKLLAVASEAKVGSRLKSETLKRLCSPEKITARFLHKNYFEFVNRAKLVFSMNETPTIDDSSEGTLRRLKVLQFNRSFEHTANPDLLGDLKSELPGILNFALDGVDNFWTEGLNPYPEMINFQNTLRLQINSPAVFFDTCIEKDADKKLQATYAYEQYNYWSKDKGIQPISQKVFGEAMQRRFPNTHRKISRYYYVGLKYSGYPYLEEFDPHYHSDEEL